VIVLSARSGSHDTVVALDLGAVGYMSNPLHSNERSSASTATTRLTCGLGGARRLLRLFMRFGQWKHFDALSLVSDVPMRSGQVSVAAVSRCRGVAGLGVTKP
jgi:CheY-like chemotaxis protein